MRSISDIVRQFKLQWTEQLSDKAIANACRDSGMSWLESTLNPVVTIQIFFLQIPDAKTFYSWCIDTPATKLEWN